MPSAPERDGLLPLAWARVAIGALFLFRTTPLGGLIDPALGSDAHPLLGWPHADASLAFGFGLSAAALKALCVVRTLGLVAFTLGLCARPAGLLAAAAGALVLMQSPFGFTSTQQLLLEATALLALADSSTALALWREEARAPASSRWMLRAFVASVYAWAAFAKLRPDWLDGRTLALFHESGRLSGPLADALLATPGRCAILGPAIAFGELSLGPLLLIRRTRWAGIALAFAFHAGIEWMGHPDVIGWAMLGLLLVFVEPRRQRRQAADASGQTTSP
jgi:hypothetical protein